MKRQHWSYHLTVGLYFIAQMVVAIDGLGKDAGLLLILCWGATFLFGAVMIRMLLAGEDVE